MSNNSRIHNLDYLRGLSIFGIMVCHFFTWKERKLYSNSFLGSDVKLGNRRSVKNKTK